MIAETASTGSHLEGLPVLYQQNFPPETFQRRRSSIIEEIGSGAIAVIQGAPRSGSSSLFRQSNEMYYLCGVEVPNAYLILSGITGESTLYLEHRDPGSARTEGERLHADQPDVVVELTGVDHVQPIERLSGDLWRHSLKPLPPEVFLATRPAEGTAASRDSLLEAEAGIAADPWAATAPRHARFADRLHTTFPAMNQRDLTPILDRMREVKDPIEIDLLRRAGHLTAMGLAAAMRSTRPGRMEYELAAVAQFVFAAGGARGEGYRGIVGGGANAWFGHYGRQSDPLVEGDLVLMDYAADFAYYTSDIGRMWPVDGRFTDEQRVLYGFIVDYHRELLDRIRPGALTDEIMDEVADVMAGRIDGIAWSSDAHETAARGALTFRGHFSHPVGMAVHDVGDYRRVPLVEGVVFSVDPMIWIPEELRYIRCEDTVVVTSEGCENLTVAAPLDCDEIESAMAEDGILDLWDSMSVRKR